MIQRRNDKSLVQLRAGGGYGQVDEFVILKKDATTFAPGFGNRAESMIPTSYLLE